jgi:hypothetical protein
MTKAIVPQSIPGLPEDGISWLRSTRGRGGMFHIHTGIGSTACGTIRLDRHRSQSPRGLSDFMYWGCCPRCLKKVPEGQRGEHKDNLPLGGEVYVEGDVRVYLYRGSLKGHPDKCEVRVKGESSSTWVERSKLRPVREAE